MQVGSWPPSRNCALQLPDRLTFAQEKQQPWTASAFRCPEKIYFDGQASTTEQPKQV
ncbi:MAG: hypothetical protein LUH52_06060 [Bacteroides uniformis]|nr:hypothetical protein [Bacteroides uniformis]